MLLAHKKTSRGNGAKLEELGFQVDLSSFVSAFLFSSWSGLVPQPAPVKHGTAQGTTVTEGFRHWVFSSRRPWGCFSSAAVNRDTSALIRRSIADGVLCGISLMEGETEAFGFSKALAGQSHMQAEWWRAVSGLILVLEHSRKLQHKMDIGFWVGKTTTCLSGAHLG